MKLLLFLPFVFLLSCVTTSQKLNPAVYYKNDMCFKYDKKEFCGVGLLPAKDDYEIKVKSYGKLNFFSLTTCHREDTTENPDDGIFRVNGNTKIKFKPEIEKEKACPMYVAAYNMDAKHAWGIIAFENPRFKLKAKLECNGDVVKNNGVSICQSRQGLIQRITFNEEVVMGKPIAGPEDRNKPCNELPTSDNKVFEFELSNRECRYVFLGKESKELHTLYTIGYEDIVIREQ